jgi:hypothetical protein
MYLALPKSSVQLASRFSWAFAIGSDVATDDFGHLVYLDVHVRFPGIDAGDNLLLSFHLLALPLFEETHSGQSLYSFFSKVFEALCSTWKERIIGSSTDGAPNMTGCNVGFTTRLAIAAGVDRGFYHVWCLAHQLDLTIKASLHAIADATGHDFSFLQAWYRCRSCADLRPNRCTDLSELGQ